MFLNLLDILAKQMRWEALLSMLKVFANGLSEFIKTRVAYITAERFCLSYATRSTHYFENFTSGCQELLYMSCLMTKPTKWLCAQRRLRSAWAFAQSDQSLLCAQCVAKDPSFLHGDSDDSDQTGWMPRLIRVFAGCTCHFVGFVMRQLTWFK